MTARVAIIGAGLAGSLASLSLARRGIEVDLIDRHDEPVTEASYFNEGKIHLGFLYAHDRTRDTSRLMIEGARTFREIVLDLVGTDVAGILSTPFLYAVHRDSLLAPGDLERHLRECCREFGTAVSAGGGAYVDGERAVTARRVAREEWCPDLDPSAFAAVFETSERAIDPRLLALSVREAVRECARISWHPATRVDAVAEAGAGRWRLLGADGSDAAGSAYDIVVNATWSDLLRLDAQVGLTPPPQWSYRYKLGNRVLRPVRPADLSSVTVVLGAFGDIVNFGERGGIFLSWYPSGRLLMTDEIDLPDWNGPDFEAIRESAYAESLRTWESLSARLRGLGVGEDPVDVRGGMILATGRTDVDDPASPLHARVQVGIERRGTYVSVNTGKFTLAPLMAVRAADEVAALLGP